MSGNVSTHQPFVARGIVSVTGSLSVDTGLRDIQGGAVSMMGAVTANEESIVTWEKDATRTGFVTIRVYKGGTNHADAGDSAVDVSYYFESK